MLGDSAAMVFFETLESDLVAGMKRAVAGQKLTADIERHVQFRTVCGLPVNNRTLFVSCNRHRDRVDQRTDAFDLDRDGVTGFQPNRRFACEAHAFRSASQNHGAGGKRFVGG